MLLEDDILLILKLIAQVIGLIMDGKGLKLTWMHFGVALDFLNGL